MLGHRAPLLSISFIANLTTKRKLKTILGVRLSHGQVPPACLCNWTYASLYNKTVILTSCLKIRQPSMSADNRFKPDGPWACWTIWTKRKILYFDKWTYLVLSSASMLLRPILGGMFPSCTASHAIAKRSMYPSCKCGRVRNVRAHAHCTSLTVAQLCAFVIIQYSWSNGCLVYYQTSVTSAIFLPALLSQGQPVRLVNVYKIDWLEILYSYDCRSTVLTQLQDA